MQVIVFVTYNKKKLMNPLLKSTRMVLLALALLYANGLFAQEPIRITGKVADNNGAPLSSVTVSVKGTRTTVTTDADGAFTISVPKPSSSLVFSYVGYQVQEIAVGGRSSLDIRLTPLNANMNEVVVVGYGTQKKREITSAITRVDAEQFNKGNISDVSQLLQGKVAGLSISKPGGDPNAGYTIRLRGLSTLGANTSPLIVIDGQIGADINSVDPNNIASMDVLKDDTSPPISYTPVHPPHLLLTP